MLLIANLPRCKCAKNYQNRAWFDKVIAKIKWCSFFDSHGRVILNVRFPKLLSLTHTTFSLEYYAKSYKTRRLKRKTFDLWRLLDLMTLAHLLCLPLWFCSACCSSDSMVHIWFCPVLFLCQGFQKSIHSIVESVKLLFLERVGDEFLSGTLLSCSQNVHNKNNKLCYAGCVCCMFVDELCNLWLC